MARNTTTTLDTGDTFPRLSIDTIDGKTLVLPDDLTHPFNVVLVNRGHWCPFCNQQLRAFQGGLARLEEEGIGVVSISSDPLDKAQSVATANGLTFPVGYGADVEAVAHTLGTYYDATPPAGLAPYLQASSFVLGPNGRILVATYSSSAIGRLVWQDALGFVQYVKSHS